MRNMVMATPAPVRNVVLTIVLVGHMAGCATVGGAVVGAGIGAIAGDAEMGMAIGATTGAAIDIFERR